MRPSSPAVLALLVFTAAAWSGPSGVAVAQPAPSAAPAHEIPQSLRLEHEDTINQLSLLAQRHGAVGEQARKALVLFKRHVAREQEYIMPPLTLLPDLADGKATPDMAWAVAMSDRVRADREAIFQEHTQLTESLNAILMAAQQAHDKDAIAFAQAAAADPPRRPSSTLEPAVDGRSAATTCAASRRRPT